MPYSVSARAGRRLATAAALGGGGLGFLGASSYALLRLQGILARRAIHGVALHDPPEADGDYGRGSDPCLRLVVLGDSSAASFGVDRTEDALGALVAAGVATRAGRPVALSTYAMVGARSEHLAGQITRACEHPVDAAVVLVGAYDVTHRVSNQESVRFLDAAVRRLRDQGAEVVVATCPDLGTVEPIPPPLRWLARRWSRRLAAAQTVAIVEAGGRAVSLGSTLGPEFDTRGAEMFSADRFHPSAAGYRAAARAILPSLLGALGLDDAHTDAPDSAQGGTVTVVTRQ